MNPDVAPLANRFAHLGQIVADADMANLHHWTAHRSDATWNANWKLVIANAMESYHLFKVHDETLEPYTPTGDHYTLLSLPPNFVGVLTNDSLLWEAVQPTVFDRTRIVTGGAYRHPTPEDSKGLSKLTSVTTAAAGAMLPDFLSEDEDICERGQRAAAGDYTPGVLVPMEQVISDFHHYLNRQLHGADVPPVRTVPEVGLPRKTEEVSV